MNTQVLKNCELLVENRDTIKSVFKWNSDSMMLAGSSVFVGLSVRADAAKMKECETILKENTGMMTGFRGNVKMPVLCKMAVSTDPAGYLDYLKDVTDQIRQIKKLKWIDGDFKILAAMTICDHAAVSEIPQALERMTDLYLGMRETHPWITGDEDLPFAAMLAVSGMDTKALLVEMEKCYHLLTNRFHDKDAVQSLSHVLSVDPAEAETKCLRIEKMFDLLKTQKHKFGTGYELAVLGTMSVLQIPEETAVAEIIEADDFLKKQKGFGSFTMGDTTRRMYAALMVMDAHMPPASRSHESLVNSMLAIIIAMEICMIIMMTTVITTTSTSH